VKPEHDIRDIFSHPIIMQGFATITVCPNCGYYEFNCIENYVNDNDVPVRIFECDFCGAMWEVEDELS
jgi:hypothetical protein